MERGRKYVFGILVLMIVVIFGISMISAHDFGLGKNTKSWGDKTWKHSMKTVFSPEDTTWKYPLNEEFSFEGKKFGYSHFGKKDFSGCSRFAE